MDCTIHEKFFIVLRGRSMKGFCRGSIGCVVAEPQRGVMQGLMFSSVGGPKDGGTVKKEDTYRLTRQQAQLLLYSPSVNKRLALLSKQQLLNAICELAKGDLVVVYHKKAYMVGLVKNIMLIGKRQNQHDLGMLAFEVECVDHDTNLSSKNPPPLHLFCATDIMQVIPTRSPPRELQWLEYGGLDGRVGTPINSMPYQGSRVRPVREACTEQRASRAPLDVGSAVEVASNTGVTVYGVIRWLGLLNGKTGVWAGVELDYDVRGCSNGTYGGQWYFTCKEKRGLFVPITKCSRDKRLSCRSTQRNTSKFIEIPPATPYDETQEDAPPLDGAEALSLIVGRMKGIQGTTNSCYLDATLFSLFASAINLEICQFTPETEQPNFKALREIVNRLRRDGFVPAKSMMNFREQLGCKTYLTEEKDPEEFITMLFRDVLGIEPLLRLKANDESFHGAYTLQIILDKESVEEPPSVQHLLDTSCMLADLKFEEVPSLLMILMPRCGNGYKMFNHIIPTTELDVTNILTDAPRECYICGTVAIYECVECLPDGKFQPGRIKQYCHDCDTLVHKRRSRRNHTRNVLVLPDHGNLGDPIPAHKMQLFAVLCIRTNHYVTFVKCGSDHDSWVFFDSMADRHGDDADAYNIPEIRSCSELAHFLPHRPEGLVLHGNLSQLVERFVCDPYMFLFQNPDKPLSKPELNR